MEHKPKPSSFDWGRDNGPGPQTESAHERGFRVDPEVARKRGESEELDPDRTGDIADETSGHRG